MTNKNKIAYIISTTKILQSSNLEDDLINAELIKLLVNDPDAQIQLIFSRCYVSRY